MPVADGGVVPEWVHMVPGLDHVVGRDGRSYPNPSPDTVVAALNAHGADIPIDWEHSTELKAPRGEMAPAAGWLTKAELRNGTEVWCNVRWTDEGAKSIVGGQYRYLSPVFWVDKIKSNILAIKSAGLTNEPNLRLTALNRQETTLMNASTLKKLDLKEDATEADVEAALDKLLAERSQLRVETNRLQTALPLPDKFIPRADFDVVLNRAQHAEAELKRRENDDREAAINRALTDAIEEGKITPATQEDYRKICQTPEGFEAFKGLVKSMNRLDPDSGISGPPPSGKESSDTLSQVERDICRITNVSPEAFKAAANAN